MKQFTDIHEAVDAYRRGEATIDDISLAASRVITADLRRRSVTSEVHAPPAPAVEPRSA